MWGNDVKLNDCLNGSYKNVGFVAQIKVPITTDSGVVWQDAYLMDKEKPNDPSFSYTLFISNVVSRGSHAFFSSRCSAEYEVKRFYESLKKSQKDCPRYDKFFIGIKKIEFTYSMKFVE